MHAVNQPLAFAGRDAGQGIMTAAPGLHLDKNQGVIVAGDDVDFAIGTVPVARQNLVAVPSQIVGSDLFALLAYFLSLCHALIIADG